MDNKKTPLEKITSKQIKEMFIKLWEEASKPRQIIVNYNQAFHDAMVEEAKKFKIYDEEE